MICNLSKIQLSLINFLTEAEYYPGPAMPTALKNIVVIPRGDCNVSAGSIKRTTSREMNMSRVLTILLVLSWSLLRAQQAKFSYAGVNTCHKTAEKGNQDGAGRCGEGTPALRCLRHSEKIVGFIHSRRGC